MNLSQKEKNNYPILMHINGIEKDGTDIQILKDDAVKVLHSICQQIWETQQWPQDWKRLVFIAIPKKAMPKNI